MHKLSQRAKQIRKYRHVGRATAEVRIRHTARSEQQRRELLALLLKPEFGYVGFDESKREWWNTRRLDEALERYAIAQLEPPMAQQQPQAGTYGKACYEMLQLICAELGIEYRG